MLCCSKVICRKSISPKLIVKHVNNTVLVNKYFKQMALRKAKHQAHINQYDFADID
jgi:hypothetical protein